MQEAVFEYIEVDYNRNCRNSAIVYISPEAFEAKTSLRQVSVVVG